MRLDKAALYFGRSSRSMFLCMEGAFRISIYHDSAAWTGHLKLEIGVMWDRIKARKSGRPEECLAAAAERDYIEGQAFTPKLVR